MVFLSHLTYWFAGLSWRGMIRSFAVMLIAAACLAASAACSLGGPKSPAAIGDTCLDGTWTLQNEVSTSGYTLNNVPVPVSGLAGATLKFSSDGTESETFDGSAPLVGEIGGQQLSIRIGGSIRFTIHASGGQYTEKGTKTELPTTATLGGTPITYHSSYAPGHGTYQCSSEQLTVTTSDKVQTDTWLRG